MTQQRKLEKVLDYLLSEDSDNAAELLHQIIVEKARVIYESIVDDEDEVGGEPSTDFTDEISSDQDEIESDEESDGEVDDDADCEADGECEDDSDEAFGDEDAPTDERVEKLEDQLAELRAEFDALMGEEMQEPQHADLADEFGEEEFGDTDEFGEDDTVEGPDISGNEQVVGEVVATMYEKKKAAALKKAPEAKKGELKKGLKKDKKVDEETKFLSTVGDTGQRGTARLVGTGKGMTLGAEQNKSPYTNAPSKADHGGKPSKIGSGTGGEYGKYNGDTAANKTPTDNVKVTPKNSSIKADTTAKFTGGASAGPGFTKSPLSKKPA